jgi:hypothetical protein
MNKKSNLAFLSLSMVAAMLSSCGNALEKEYGPTIKRADAMSLLQAIIAKNGTSSASGPTAFSVSHTDTAAFVIIAVVPYTENMSYDKTNQYYYSEIGSIKRWVFVKDGTLYDAKYSKTTKTDASSSTYEVETKTYTVSTAGFDNEVQTAVNDKDGLTFLESRVNPQSVNSKANISEPTDTLAKLKKYNDGNGSYTDNSTTYTISNEEYRSSADGTLYISFNQNSVDGSNDKSTTNYTMGIKDYLTVTDRNKQVGTIVKLDYGYNFTWQAPSLNYPDLSTFVKQ